MTGSYEWRTLVVLQFVPVEDPRRIVKCESEETFGNLYDRFMAVSRSTVTVVKTGICASDLFIGLHPVHIVDLDTPINVCQQFGCYNVRFSLLKVCGIRIGGNSEMSLLSARRRIIFTIYLFIFIIYFFAHSTGIRETTYRFVVA